MKKIFFFVFTFYSFLVSGQITIDETLTAQELVEDVLINSPCAEVSDIGQRTGTDFGADNGIASFDANGSDFPFTTGIVLMSGDVSLAPGPNTSLNLSTGDSSWPGDADLEANTTANNTNNASAIQFNFVPQIDQINFNFIFASEEYNRGFECSFSDAFAFILTDQITGVVQNLAVIPGTTTPIEVTNVRYGIPGQCDDINTEFFQQYNFDVPGLPSVNESDAAISLNGQTVPLTAIGTVVAGNPYNIKLVIADQGDSQYDAAVFIEGGSFNLDVDLGEDLTLENRGAPCIGGTAEIGTIPFPGATYQWFVFDPVTGTFVIITGEVGPDLIINTPGLYRLEVEVSPGCIVSDEIIVEFAPLPVPGVPEALTLCDDDNDGVGFFTLTDADTQIIAGATDVVVTYYETLFAANLGIAATALPSPYQNSSNPQIVFARLEALEFGCFDTVALELIVFDTPVFIDPIPDFVLCDEDADGFTIFDLSSWDAQVTATPADLGITYYETLVEAQANTNEIDPANAYTNTSSPQTIFVRLENTDGCSAISQFNLIVNPLPIYTTPSIAPLCDYDGVLDESTEFDLSEVTTVITGDDPAFVVSYHESQIEAEAGTPALPLLYSNTSNPQTIWTRIADAVTGCFIIDTFTLTVLDTPFANVPVSLKECDTDTDGIDEFDLTQADADIIGGQTDVFVNYYLTLALAEAGDPATALASPYTNITSPQTVYGRIEKTFTGCFDITELELIVILAQPLPTYELCDDDADGFTVFDLSTYDTIVVADPTGLTITYHETEIAASAGTPFINPANTYTNLSNPQGMFVRVVNDDGCVTIGTFDLVVLPLPIYTTPSIAPLCDYDGVLDESTEFDLSEVTTVTTGDDPAFVVSYHESQIEAEAGTPALPLLYSNTSNPQTIWTRIADAVTGCFIVDSFTLTVLDTPFANTPISLKECDTDTDGIDEFDLTQADADIIGGQTDVFVNYYLTLALAEAGDPATALASPYTNITSPQTVYGRIEKTFTGCFDITELELIVILAQPLPTYELCDDDADGFTVFDLSTYDTIVVADPTGLTITYHETEIAASAGTPFINPANTYTNLSNPQGMFVRVVNDDGCVTIGTFDLVVLPLPIYTTPSIAPLCDYDGVLDESTEFDLSEVTTVTTGDDPAFVVSYHESQIEAEAGTPALPLLYSNTSNPQTIWTRIADAVTGCFIVDSFTLTVLDTPFANTPISLKECDTDTDGIDEFDLTQADADIIGGQTDVFVNYYLTLALAEAGDPATALASPYTNITSPQTVYGRIEKTFTGCFDITELELIVILSQPLPTYELCDDDVADGFTVFDLTQWDFQIAADPTGLVITYHETASAASAGMPFINPAETYTNTSNPQDMFVRVINTDGCVTIGTFDLVVLPLPIYTTPSIAPLCDYDGVLDESTEFDLSEVTTVTTGDDPAFVVSYHESQIEAEAGTPALPLLYSNTSNPQTIWTRIADAVTGCFIIDTFTLTVLDTPFANVPVSLKECDTDTDGIDEFDLTQADADIIDGQTDVFVNYYLTLALAEAGDPATALASPYTNITSPQTVYGRIEKTFTGCFDITELELIVILSQPLPTYELCDDDADGFAVFDLSTYDTIVVADPTGLTITYHETEIAASAGTPFINPANAYTNLSSPQGMFVRVVNTDGCVTIGTFDLFVNPLPLFNVPTLFELCDDAVADGFTEFDLSLKDTEITGGDPNLGVTYYLTPQDADAGTPVLVLPYTNTSNPQTVYPRISNLTTGCFDTTTLDLFVNPLPIPFPPVALERCDNNADDVALFDLTLADADIIGDQTGVFVNYYLTLADAQVGDPATALLSPYANISNPQIVFGRIEIAVTGCFDVTELELIVLPATDIGAFGTYELCDDPIADESTTFDLTTYDTIVVADPTGLTITYHETALDAAVGVGAILPADAYNNITNPQTIFVRIEDADECVEQGTFELFVIARPLFDVPSPYALCEDDISDGFTQFDLTFNDAAILGDNPDYSLRGYYFSAALAEAGGLPLPDIYTNITNPQIIFVRVDDASTGCYGVQPLELQVIAPDAITPTTYNICDELPNDGFGTFDLTTKDLEITGGNPDYFVTYFETLADAQGVVNPIVTPTAYDNTVQGFQIIYARVVDVLFPDCSSIVALELQVNDAPAITDPITDYFVCDLDGNGIETFDLTSKDAEILNSLVDVTLTYHESFADAEAGLFPITPATGYVSPSATIWVRAVNYEDGDISNDALCVTIGQFDLIIGETPSFNVIPEIEACDDEIADGITEFDLNSYNEIITGGNPDVTVTYHATQEFAQAGFPALPVFYTNTTNPEDIWVRVSDVSGCYGVFMSSLVVVPRPEIFEPLPLIYCDDDNDGFGTFILTDADEQVVGGNPAGNLVVSYHVTLSDAINGVLPLVSPYDNEVPFDQIIYVRLFDIASGCYSTTILHLLVEERPAITDPQPLVVCDTDGDGIAVFNLTSAEPDILQGLTGGPYVVSYFTDMAMTSAIVNPFSFSNSVNPQTIYVSVSDTNNDCESLTTLELRVEIPPLLVNPTPLELCDQTDILGPDDELEIFDLTSRVAEITAGDLGVSISFFESFADMQANTNAIAAPTAYQNIIGGVVQNPQTIWIRAQDVNTSCVVDTGVVTLDLIVNPLPSPITPTPLEICDIDNDGFGAFTLTDKDIEIIGGEPGVIVSYHETLSDAENNIFPIGSPYQNIVANLQVVYVRATYDDVPPALGTGCWRVVELELIVNPTPIVPLDLEPIIACDPDMDGFEVFDLTQRASDIYGTQDTTQYVLSYYLSEVAATAGTPSIASPNTFTNTVTPLQTIWIRLENVDSGCFKLGSFDIQVVDGPEVVQPNAFNKCDDLGEPFDGITTFDLTTQDAIITAGEPSVGVQYYETLANAQDDIDAINPATAYVNQINLQTIYVRVTDGNSLCVDTSVTLTLRVLPNPQPEQPDPIALCDTDGDGQEVFDLTIRAAQILDGETYDLLYYETELLAIDGVAGTEILDPTAYTNTSNPQDIYIRVTNPGSDALCFEIVVLTISVNSLPDDGVLLDDYEICELPFDGVSIFDLTTKIPEILVGQDMVNNVVSFYVTPADATAGVNPIPIPEVYQNITNPQAIYVGITNTATGCYIGGVQFFNIEVKPGATATAPLLAYTLCDQDGENDGFTSFDLTLQSLLDEILNGQDPLDYLLTFHETLANAMDAENPLGASYTNIINPQIIYARVENASSGCYDVAEVILKVNQLPVITLDESYRLCVDQNGLPIASEEGAASPPVIDTGLDDALYSFEWSIDGVVQVGETGASIIATTGGVYQATITQLSSGCQTAVSTTVTVSQAPVTWSFNLLNGAFADNHSVEILAEGLGEYVYSIDGGPFQDSNVFDNVSPGVHTITIKDANGCGQVSFDIGVVDYPNYFTPNNDGYHDTWNIIGIAEFDPGANIYIFDRYGKLLKQISPLTPGWDGTYNGNALPSSDYWFRVEYTEQGIQKEIKGHFTLKR